MVKKVTVLGKAMITHSPHALSVFFITWQKKRLVLTKMRFWTILIIMFVCSVLIGPRNHWTKNSLSASDGQWQNGDGLEDSVSREQKRSRVYFN